MEAVYIQILAQTLDLDYHVVLYGLIAVVGFFMTRKLADIEKNQEQNAEKVDELRQDMMRVKTKLGIIP